MNYNYLTLNHITAYEEFLCREERSAATKEKYLRSVRTFHSWAHGQAITKETVTAWKNCLIEQKYAPSTINTMLAALNRLFAFMGWTDCCAKYLKVQRRMFRESSRELTKEEYTRLVNSASQCGETIAMTMSARATAVRPGPNLPRFLIGKSMRTE